MIQLLEEMLNRKKSTMKKLQQLCGYLNFICRAIYLGRPFVRRMYAKYSHILNVNKGKEEDNRLTANTYRYKFKQHYHV